MSAQALAFVWKHSPYRDKTFVVHLALADVANDMNENRLWLSVRNLATKARCDRLTARKAVATLVADGFLTQLEPSTDRAPGIFRFTIHQGGEPLTRGGEPVTPGGGEPLTPIPSKELKRNSKRARAHFLPDTETLTPERRAFASTLGLTRQAIEFEWGKFADHEFAVGKTDWTKAWQNWCRAAVGRFKPNGPAPSTPSLAPSSRGSLEYRIRHGL